MNYTICPKCGSDRISWSWEIQATECDSCGYELWTPYPLDAEERQHAAWEYEEMNPE